MMDEEQDGGEEDDQNLLLQPLRTEDVSRC